MKKRIFTVVFIFVILIITIAGINGITVIKGITGRAGSSGFNISIVVSTGLLPNLTIISPKNDTYLNNESLLLNFTAQYADTIWYNLDGTSNITITSPVTFNTTQGSHTLYLYANNTNNNITSENVTFYVNLTKFIILYDEYKGAKKGSSTDFYQYSFSEMQNLSNIILENQDYGRIRFNQPINLTNDSIPNDNLLDLDNNTQISNNLITINATAIPNFNKPSTIWIYNLGFNNPRILLNGNLCSICTIESYSSGTLRFSITSLSGYLTIVAEETPGGNGNGNGNGGPSPPPVACLPNWTCGDWSKCVNTTQTRKCSDENSCDTESGKPVEMRICKPGKVIQEFPKWECQKWSECRAFYNLHDIIKGNVLLSGEQYCLEDRLKRRPCNPGKQIKIKKVSKCSIDYLEIYDMSDKLISKMHLEKGAFEKLNVDITMEESDYCFYCFDNIKNFDEDGVDCVFEKDGNCPLCQVEVFSTVTYVMTGLFLILIILTSVFFVWYLRISKKEKILQAKFLGGG
jgi:hypothetical protein